MNNRISIVIPVYNVEKYLNRCIESVINQSLKDIEIILVNDGATDSSGEICDAYAKEDNRIIVIHKNNSGLSDARNIGTAKSTCHYLMYLDSDDWINLNTCEIAYEAAVKYDTDIVIWSRIKEWADKSEQEIPIFDENRLFEGEDVKWLHRRMTGLVEKELAKPTKTDSINSAWGKLYKRDTIIKSGVEFVDTRIIGSEDTVFNFQLMFHVKRVYYLRQFLNHYWKENENSLTRNHKSTLFPRFLNLFSYLEDGINKNKSGNKFKTALDNRISLSIINTALSITGEANSANTATKIKDIGIVLKHPVYRKSIKNISLKYFPIHWKIFFYCCKIEFSTGVYWLTLQMRKLH